MMKSISAIRALKKSTPQYNGCYRSCSSISACSSAGSSERYMQYPFGYPPTNFICSILICFGSVIHNTCSPQKFFPYPACIYCISVKNQVFPSWSPPQVIIEIIVSQSQGRTECKEHAIFVQYKNSDHLSQ